MSLNTDRPDDAEFIRDREKIAQEMYEGAVAFAKRCQQVERGQFDIPKDIENASIQLEVPSEGFYILKKAMTLMAGGANIKWKSMWPGDNPTPLETKDANRREDITDALWHTWYLQDHKLKQRQLLDYGLRRGWSVGVVSYTPRVSEKGMVDAFPLTLEVPDPLTIFPVPFQNPQYYIRKFKQPAWILMDFWDSVDTKDNEWQKPDLSKYKQRSKKANLRTEVEVTEYCNAKYRAFLIDGQFVGPMAHDYGVLPMGMFRVHQSGDEDPRWGCQPFIGPAIYDIMNKAKVVSKVATAVNTFYYPLLLAKSTTGKPIIIDPHSNIGEIKNVDPDTELQIIVPQTNDALIQILMGHFDTSIFRATLSLSAFQEDLSGLSGHARNTTANLIRDDMNDTVRAFESSVEDISSIGLRMLEKFSAKEPLKLPGYIDLDNIKGGKRSVITVKPKDINGLYQISASLRIQTRANRMEDMTLAAQAIAQMTDGHLLDRRTILETFDLTDRPWVELEDRRWAEKIKNEDEEIMAMQHDIHRSKVQEGLLPDWEKAQLVLAALDDKMAVTEQRQAEKDTKRRAKQGVDGGFFVPAELQEHPQLIPTIMMAIESGQNIQEAIDRLAETGQGALADPLSPDALAVQGVEPGAQAALAEQQLPPVPTSVQPPIEQGIPPQPVNTSQQEVEQMEEFMRRGGVLRPNRGNGREEFG